MTEKRKNPYQYLLEQIKEFCDNLKYRHQITMWKYPKNRLSEGWPLLKLYERVKAAEQLGYDMQVIAQDDGLLIQYVKQIPHIPGEWRK